MYLLEAILQLIIMVFGFLIILHGVGLLPKKHSPGRILGRMIRATLRGSWWLTKIVCIATFELASGLATGLIKGAPSNTPHPAYGTGKFLEDRDRRRLLNRRHTGVVVNGDRARLNDKMSQMGIAVVGSSGRGKSTIYSIPSVLQIEHSMVILDPSSEIYDLTSGYLATRGFNVKVVSVSDVARSYRFNPLAYASTSGERRQIGRTLIETAYTDKRSDNSYWTDGGAKFLGLLLESLVNEPAEFQNLPNLKFLVDNFGSNGEALNNFIDRNASERVFAAYKSFLAQPEKQRLGQVSTASIALEPFSDESICTLMSENTIDFSSLRKEKTALFISVPEHLVSHYRFFLILLYSALFNFAMTPPQPGEQSIFFILDEFGNAGAIPSFSNYLTSLRKRRVSVSILLQSESQLHKAYGRDDAETILSGGISNRLYLSGQDMASALALERALGETGVTVEDENGRRRVLSRSLMTADEIMAMPPDQALFVHAGHRPVLFKTRPYYKNRRLLKRTRIPPAPLPENKTSTEIHYVPLDGKGTGKRHRAEAKMGHPKPRHEGGTHSPPKEAPETTRSNQPLSEPSQVSVLSTSEPNTPSWAHEVSQEIRYARQEIETLRDAVQLHIISRKEAAQLLGVSTKTLQRWEKKGRIERVPGSSKTVMYTMDSILKLKEEQS